MSLYTNRAKVDGVPCGMMMRGVANGHYILLFEREFATLEQVEGINWARPTIEGDSILPVGYGFEVEDIGYRSDDRAYQVTVRVAEQYLGDVAGYQAQVAELENTVTRQSATIAEQAAEIAELEAAGSAAALEADMAAAYTEGVESNG